MFYLIGINYQSAPEQSRARAGLSGEQLRQLVGKANLRPEVASMAALQTCHRLELLFWLESRGDAEGLVTSLHEIQPASREIPQKYWYTKKNIEVVRHEFRLAAGLESLLLGETEILGQMKDAYRLYCETTESHPMLNRLFHEAFRCGKKVRTETGLGRGAVSLASAAVDFLHTEMGGLEGCTALVAGAGRTGSQVAGRLAKLSPARLWITNPTYARAEALARETGGEPIPFEQMQQALPEANTAFFCLSSERPVLDRKKLKQFFQKKRQQPVNLFDLGFPRNVEPQAEDHPHVRLYSLETLEKRASQNLKQRQGEVPRAEAMVEEALVDWQSWIKSLDHQILIGDLMKKMDSIRERELQKRLEQFPRENREQLDRFTRSLLKQVFHEPIQRIRDCAEDSRERFRRLETLRYVFGLDDEKEH